MALSTIVLVVAALLAIVSFGEPLAQRLRLPATVILAAIGIVIGAASTLLGDSATGAFGTAVRVIGELPINSQVFLTIFLPALLFQGALNIQVREMAGDAGPILMMAIVAVLAATVTIGFALWPMSDFPLIACLLVGAIVATTDPSAVIAIFRDLGAPQRLARLVEGESLLNDAAAITLFVIFTGFLVQGGEVDVGNAGFRFLAVPLAGALVGTVAGRLTAALFSLSGGDRMVQVSLSVALPYLVFAGSEHFHVSGPIAVVAAGLTLNATGPARVSPAGWRYLKDVWDQLAFWAGSLVFVLAAILVPELMRDMGWRELGWLVAMVATALASRAAVLYLFVPALTRLRISPKISPAYKLVILWGGLRGAVTLALALAVTENPALPDDIKRFVAVLATAFVLFTLLVQGTTLRPLMRALGIDKLRGVDASLRRQALQLAHAEVREAVASTAREYGLAPRLAAEVAASYSGEQTPDETQEIALQDKVALGLSALAAREHDLVLQHLDAGTLAPGRAASLLAGTRRLLDAARLGGAEAYAAEASATLQFPWRMRLANALHARFGVSSFLERQMARRFETLLALRIVLDALRDFADRQLSALLGGEVGEAARTALAERREATARSLDALRLQYPDYADQLERRFLHMSALRQERRGYEQLYEEGLIGPEVRRALLSEVEARSRGEERPRLDLKLNTPSLIRRVPLFAAFTERQAEEIRRLMRPAFAMPGQRLITRGERGDAAWFIASGAVEVDTGSALIRLGRGDFFGELALLTGLRRQADVTAIAYCDLLLLHARDFHTFLARHPEIRAEVEKVAAERLGSEPGASLDPRGWRRRGAGRRDGESRA